MNWRFKVKLKDILDQYEEFDELESVKKTKSALAKRMRTYACLDGLRLNFSTIKTEAQFNRALSKLYDYCDSHAIWVD